MAMDKVIKPEEQEYISPLISFKEFKEKALSARDIFRNTLKLPAVRMFVYPDDLPEKPPHLAGKLGGAFDRPFERDDGQRIRGIVKLGVPLEEANTSLASLRMAEDLAEYNRRDVFFRRNVEVEDLPAETHLETLKIRAKTLEKLKPLKKPFRRTEDERIRAKTLEKLKPLKKPFRRTEDERGDEKRYHERAKMQQLIFQTTRRLKYANYYENDMHHTRISETVEPSVVNDIVVTLVICKPYNHVPQPHERRALRFKYPSSFIFIHDTFYVPQQFYVSEQTLAQLDTSKMTPMTDISLPIRKWMEKKKDLFGVVQVKDIAGVQVQDLVCMLGYPYVYVHQGSCEHVFYFTDLRLMDAQDYPISFPQMLSDTSFEHNCKICRRHVAQWIVEGEEMSADPVHMCEGCFTSYHFVYLHRRDLKSRAHPYVDPSCLQL
ncbi:snRNA-activating protein complex subunit 3 [Toxocara canis]|uniref:snRNA-activating protein complex subunit 3 n=1 Tax=Toxocara canis TaxID=6265 RepID=A0A0B2VXE2_TOXCA|nr:snRNA-activating protein complex subunit 3 [Toxocara canis]